MTLSVRRWMWCFTALLLLALLTACTGAPFGFLQPEPTLTPTSAAQKATLTPTLESTRGATVTPSGPQTLVVWLPPQFDPNSNTPAGDKLRARLEAFQAENPHSRSRCASKQHLAWVDCSNRFP